MLYRILTFTGMLLFYVVWFAIKPSLQAALLTVTAEAGLLGEFLGKLLFLILEIILFVEVIFKVSLLGAIQPFKAIPTSVEDWPDIDPQELQTQTKVLEQLGFTRAIDYTVPRFRGLIRLLFHPEQQCYAELFQVGKQPMTLALGSQLEQNHLIAASNQPQDRPLLTGYWYAFFRVPLHFFKRFAEMSSSALVPEFLALRQELTTRLNLQILPVTTIEDHFQMIQKIRKLQRQSLLKKSIILSFFDMLIFVANPKYEYLGQDLSPNLSGKG
jgi:hypothetical protein